MGHALCGWCQPNESRENNRRQWASHIAAQTNTRPGLVTPYDGLARSVGARCYCAPAANLIPSIKDSRYRAHAILSQWVPSRWPIYVSQHRRALLGPGCSGYRKALLEVYRMTQRASIPGLITIGELASWLRISQKTIVRLLKKNALPQPIHLGRSLRWSTQQIGAWLDTANIAA